MTFLYCWKGGKNTNIRLATRPSTIYLFLSYCKLKICVGIWLVDKGEVPPFAVDAFEAMAEHSIPENMTVGNLLVGQIHVVGMALDAEPVERAAHVEFLACLLIDQGKVDS